MVGEMAVRTTRANFAGALEIPGSQQLTFVRACFCRSNLYQNHFAHPALHCIIWLRFVSADPGVPNDGYCDDGTPISPPSGSTPTALPINVQVSGSIYDTMLILFGLGLGLGHVHPCTQHTTSARVGARTLYRATAVM